MATAKFISGDGVPHEVDDQSVAFKIMSKDGSFKRVDASAPIAAADGETAPTRAELIALAKDLGIPAKGKNTELLAAIEAKQVENAATEPSE